MAQKNETLVLVLAFLVTAGLVGASLWWFNLHSSINLTKLGNSTQGNSGQKPSSTPLSTPNQPNQIGQSKRDNFVSVQNVPPGVFNYGGSTSWAPIRLTVDGAIQADRPEFRLRYFNPPGSPPSSGTGIRMLINDELSFSQSSRPILDQEYSQAQRRGFRLQQIPIALDALAVAVNPSLKIPGLTIDQLKSIYTGKVTNWKQVGGPDLKITPYSHPNNTGSTFEEQVLSGQAFGANVKFISTTTQALQELAKNPGGIFYASAPELVPQCTVKPLPIGRTLGELVPPYQEPFIPLSECPNQRNQLNTQAFQKGQYPLTRNLFVVVKQNGRTDELAGVAYANLLLTTQGQELIAKAGFVRIR